MELIDDNIDLLQAQERVVELQEEVRDLDKQEKEITLSLKDVLAELSSPEDSDGEHDGPLCGLNATDEARIAAMSAEDKANAQAIMEKMKAVNIEPDPAASIAELYRKRTYRKMAERKINKLNRFLEDSNFDDSYSEDGYMKELTALKELYQEEQRPGLLELVAFFNHQKKKFQFFFGSSGSENEDEEEERDEPLQG